jgi:hypothetical protein
MEAIKKCNIYLSVRNFFLYIWNSVEFDFEDPREQYPGAIFYD